MAKTRKAHAMGVSHVALEVADIEEALTFYGRLFESVAPACVTLAALARCYLNTSA